MDLIHFLVTGSFNSGNLTYLDSIIREKSIGFTVGSTVFLLVLVAIATLIKKQSEVVKWLLFGSMVSIISINTLYLAGSTIYRNYRSVTGGPIHWHADFEIWNCGEKVNLEDPTGWSNKIGTPVYHEHNDERLHVEGVVLHQGDISLGNFFNIIGGNLNSRNLTAPLNDGILNLNNGDYCGDGPGMVQVFVYQTSGSAFSQKKLLYPEDYILSGHSSVPPGDCIIIDFDSEIKEKTDKMCTSYRVQEQLGKIKGE